MILFNGKGVYYFCHMEPEKSKLAELQCICETSFCFLVLEIGLAQDRYRWRALVNVVMNLRVPYNAGKLPSGCATCGLLSDTQLHRVSYSDD
jgi:hypothetical protein